MKDQFGLEAPDDLVVLEKGWIDLFPPSVIRAIDRLDWYQYRLADGTTTPVLVSDAALRTVADSLVFDTYSLSECGFELTASVELEQIAGVLHRYHEQDGWYHA